MKLTNVATHLESSLMQAERWLQNERSERISCLVLDYRRQSEEGGSGFIDLPETARVQFSTAPRTCHRSGKGYVLEIAYLGDMDGWQALFAGLAETCQEELPDLQDKWRSLNPLDHWVVALVELQRLSLLPASAGGRRMNLDRRILSIAGNALDVSDPRWPIDQPLRSELGHVSNALKQSAEDYGYYARFPDLRHSSVYALRWMKAKLQSLNKSPDAAEKVAQRSVKDISIRDRKKYLDRADIVLQWHEADTPTPKNTRRGQSLTRWIESVPGMPSVREFEKLRNADRKCRQRFGFTQKQNPSKSHREIQTSWVNALKSGT